jgi:hypothetical protein
VTNLTQRAEERRVEPPTSCPNEGRFRGSKFFFQDAHASPTSTLSHDVELSFETSFLDILEQCILAIIASFGRLGVDVKFHFLQLFLGDASDPQ